MLVLSTTAEFCQGDDFIRDGVRRLLAPDATESEIWINRFGVNGCGDATNVWQALRNMPPPEEYLPHARAFVCAGTPAWLNNNTDWWERCIAHGTPIWLIGVGSQQSGGDVLERGKHLIEVATVRDHGADTMLTAAGVEWRRFLDPGFHAPYFFPRAKRFDVVLVYREKGHIHEADRATRDEAYRSVFARYRSRIDVVAVHEPHEAHIARDLFGVEPFFSHDHRRYADIYCAARAVIGGRLHAAIPALAGGGEAHLLYNNAKTEGVTAHEWLPVTAHTHEDCDAIELGIEGDAVQERIEADRAAHAAYLRGAVRG